jgi:hypothetical protein
MLSPHYIAPIMKLLLNDEVVRMCKEAVVAEYEVLSWNFLETT